MHAYCDRLAELEPRHRAPRKTVAVAIPKLLDGPTCDYLILVSQSAKAVTLFSDATEIAFELVFVPAGYVGRGPQGHLAEGSRPDS